MGYSGEKTTEPTKKAKLLIALSNGEVITKHFTSPEEFFHILLEEKLKTIVTQGFRSKNTYYSPNVICFIDIE